MELQETEDTTVLVSTAPVQEVITCMKLHASDKDIHWEWSKKLL